MRTIQHTILVLTGAVSIFMAGCQCPCGDSESAQTPATCDPNGKLVLVKDGKSVAPIVVFENAPPKIRLAVDELAAYMEKISGAKPTIIKGTPSTIPEHAIWIGVQPAVRKLFPGIDFKFVKPEEILIAANENHLVIAGRDKWNPDALQLQGKRSPINGRQIEYGTVNAVYTFLQDFLGVRWLWPGELGEDAPTMKTIAFDPFEFRYYPQLRARTGVFSYSRLGNEGFYGRSQNWSRRQRLRLDSMDMPAGHAFTTWWERFREDHPEFFALQPDGTRSGFPNPRTVKLCQSNPDIPNVWLDDVADQLEKDPNVTVFNGSPNDGWASGHCVCANCLRWDHPDGKTRRYHWQGMGQENPALSDRHVTFANQLARALKKRYPDKDYDVLLVSYGNSRPAPVEAIPDDNVIISCCSNFLMGKPDAVDRGSVDGETYRQQFDDWADVAPRLLWRPNTGSPAGWQQGQPDIPIHQTIDNMRFVADNHCVGMFIDMVWEHWATCGPFYYILGKMVWNPHLDGEAVLDDYYSRGFGPAAQRSKRIGSCLRTLEINGFSRTGSMPTFTTTSCSTKPTLC